MQRPEFTSVIPHSVERYPEGKAITGFDRGDFILVHGRSFFSRLIRFGEALRVHGPDRKYAYWNHAALITSSDGELIEATGTGALERTECTSRPPTWRSTTTYQDTAWSAGQ